MKRLALALLALALTASLVAAHDFWLIPVGDEIHGISSSSFPASDNAVNPARLAEAVAVSAAGRTPLEIVGAAFVNGKDSVLVLRADPSLRGTFWAAVAVKPREIRLTAEQFNDYLDHDGLPHIYRLREQRGELGKPAVERYQKYAKALITRPGGVSVALQPVGHRIELVPLADPAGLAAGDTLRVTVRFEGKPVPGLTVHAGYAGQPGGTHAQTHLTDAQGQVAVPVTRPGLWYLRTIHMVEIREPPFEWESFWASLTFRVP
ncbi:MAG TPA: DUF4198 domain-containing protein [Gemmatimonadales bacterium]|nr:DUF4198 domain-containing protein [Gemmatimonadales bacterium]